MKVENPWNKNNWIMFAKDMACNGEVSLTIKSRSDVATGWWWSLKWIGTDDKEHEEVGMSLDIALDQAIKKEICLQQAKLDELEAKGNEVMAEGGCNE